MNVINPAFADLIDEGIIEAARAQRSFAEIIQALAEDHDAHVAAIDAADKRNDADLKAIAMLERDDV